MRGALERQRHAAVTRTNVALAGLLAGILAGSSCLSALVRADHYDTLWEAVCSPRDVTTESRP